MNSENERSRMLRGSRWSEIVMAVSRNLTYVLSIVATLCAVAASSQRGEEADALYGATWVLLSGATLAILLMLMINYFVIEKPETVVDPVADDAEYSDTDRPLPGRKI